MNSAKPNEAGQIWTLFLISADLNDLMDPPPMSTGDQ